MTNDELLEPVKRLRDAYDELKAGVQRATWEVNHGNTRGGIRKLSEAHKRAENILEGRDG